MVERWSGNYIILDACLYLTKAMKIKLILLNILRPALSFQYLSPTPIHLPFFWGIKKGYLEKDGMSHFHWQLAVTEFSPLEFEQK